MLRRRVVGGALAALAIAAGAGLALVLSTSEPAVGETVSTTTVSTTTVTVSPRHVAIRYYAGRVSDGKRTPFSLAVRFRHSRPSALIAVRTGALSLSCETDTESRHFHFRWPRGGGSLRPRLEGYFSLEITHAEPDGTVDSHSRLRGLVESRRAMGALRIKTHNDAHGRCDSSTLAWQALRRRH